MISPDDIRRKAENLYPQFLRAWLDGDEDFFPRVISSRKTPADNLATAIEQIRQIREHSKGSRGFGYTVEWKEINSRKFGRNLFPNRILFETRDDFLRFIGKQQEFTSFAEGVSRIRASFPELELWLQANIRMFRESLCELDGLLEVLAYFRDHPRPGLFARELPLAVDTKFIEQHQPILCQWFDLVLPPETIRADENHFERRYGLQYPQPHLLIRFLDRNVQRAAGFPCAEISLPLQAFRELPISANGVVIVENKVNLLTLPHVAGAVALGGLGNGVSLLREIPWLEKLPIVYWGDIDIEGFHILSHLRGIYPQTRSIMMDRETITAWRNTLAIQGNNRSLTAPAHLTDSERAALAICTDDNIRIEQERIPQTFVENVFHNLDG